MTGATETTPTGDTPENGDTPETSEQHNAILATLSRTLQDWRGRLDEMRVQIDLAEMDSREDLRKRFSVAENAWLAAKRQLEGIGSATGSGLEAVRKAVDDAVKAVKGAVDAASSVVKRG